MILQMMGIILSMMWVYLVNLSTVPRFFTSLGPAVELNRAGR